MTDVASTTCAVDLAARHLGAGVVAASDESFGDKEHLLVEAEPHFVPGRYDHRGEVVDGWETRRRRDGGELDWAVIRLAPAGRIHRIGVDTRHFTGNHPARCLVEASGVEGYPSPDELARADWSVVVGWTALTGDAHHLFDVGDARRFTHLRLAIAPDGGVARLRVRGEVVVDPRAMDGLTVDVASQRFGGRVTASSDDFYTSAQVLNRPDRARTMGEGWETRRRRDDEHDWVVVRLAARSHLRQVEVDTSHFVYNASATCAVWLSDEDDPDPREDVAWWPLLGPTRLQPDTLHVFGVDPSRAARHARLDVYPDGGLARLRLRGAVEGAARRDLGLRWLGSLPTPQLVDVLVGGAGLTPSAAQQLADERLLGAGEQGLQDGHVDTFLELARGNPRLAALINGG